MEHFYPHIQDNVLPSLSTSCILTHIITILSLIRWVKKRPNQQVTWSNLLFFNVLQQ